MLDLVDASHFNPLTGKVCDVHLPNGSILPMQVDCVTAKPQSRNPYAPATRRMPFSVGLTATQTTEFVEGPCVIDLENFGRLEGVFVARVAPLGRDPNGAYYQIVFN